ncbi:translocon-associated protein subunit alpha-like [Actinia tenebrosa]|uniref:Translocon-associated protein subunit alpha n=1 Tax=Actinia tenebrosa TaxID=6105 RepID=A0A6P8IVP0_ACTTE|nr:translocon-associated protein subunit alpha-like [Actinia tenebrosa]
MFRLLEKFLLLTLLVLPSTLLLNGNVVIAQEDELEDEEPNAQGASDDGDTTAEDEDAKVEDEEQTAKETPEESTTEESAPKETVKGDAEEEEKEDQLKSSPDADSVILFVKNNDQQFIAGVVSKCLVSFSNNGRNDFVIDMMEASLRYPQDYSYYIQNFTAFQYNTIVKPGEQANFEYAFHPHESFGGRPFGLSINLLYKDADGKHFRDAVFNETVQLSESDEGMDGETFFLYLFIVAVGALVVMGGYYGLSSIKGKKASKPAVEMGTQQDGDIDYEWLPKETTTEFVKNSPRRSPRNRRQKRNTGSDE